MFIPRKREISTELTSIFQSQTQNKKQTVLANFDLRQGHFAQLDEAALATDHAHTRNILTTSYQTETL